ncbi:MAG: hypothetical protein PHT48_11100 [Dechloromonas sp.]|nr:hypothetical protein [Dechloromonas sp.]
MLTSEDLTYPDDAFGDRFAIADLPLPRPAMGYAVQRLDTDCLLDQQSGDFLPVRTPSLKALHPNFSSAHAAATDWVRHHLPPGRDHGLAIIPASFDAVRQRHILIYGVLCGRP